MASYTLEQLAEELREVDRHHAAVIKKVDDHHASRIDALMEKVEFLQVQLAEVSTRLQKLERHQR